MEQLRRWRLQIHAKHSRQARGGFLGVRILTTMDKERVGLDGEREMKR